jgi:hypothetical protein
MDNITFFIHVYYPGSWKLITGKCGHLFTGGAQIIVSACHDAVIEEIRALNPEATILKVPNKGKDIGGKLASLSYYYNFCEPAKYFAFLHDKISPQTLNAGYWFDQLYDIFSPEKFQGIISLLASTKNVGIAGSKAFLKNEYSRSKKRFDTTNDGILHELLVTYQLNPATYDYIGGTIFVARSDAMDGFFKKNRPLEIRQKLEAGNVLDLEHGTYTHSWERLLCFIPQANGYKLAGI